MKKLLAPLVLAALLLSGCGGPAKDQSYKHINDLAAAYEKAIDGAKCDRTENDINDNDWIFTNCGPVTILMMFNSDAKRQEILAKNPTKPGHLLVQGKNWVVNATQYEAEEAHASLGGELIK